MARSSGGGPFLWYVYVELIRNTLLQHAPQCQRRSRSVFAVLRFRSRVSFSLTSFLLWTGRIPLVEHSKFKNCALHEGRD